VAFFSFASRNIVASKTAGIIVTSIMASRFVCSLCTGRVFSCAKSYLWHLRVRHANDARFRVTCGISGCRNEYDKYSSYYKHLRRKHSDVYLSSLSEGGLVEAESHEDDAIADLETPFEAVDTVVMQNKLYAQVNESLLLYSLKLREKFLLPASTHEEILTDSKSFLTSVLTCHSEVVRQHLVNSGYNVAHDLQLTRLLDADEHEYMLRNYSSSYLLTQTCNKKLGLITPELHVVGNYKSYYIPLTKVLQMLLQKDDVLQHVLQTNASDKVNMTNFTGGNKFSSLACLKTDANMLYIHLYNDEFEVVNPIGPKRGKYKINATYFSLGNLPSKCRSNLKHIYLTNVVRHKAVKEEGYMVAFQALVKELEVLFDEGITVSLPDGRTYRFFVVVSSISGDNLSSHALGGFRQVFNSGRVCRFCMIMHAKLTDKMCEDELILRNSKNHAYHIQAVQDNPDNAAVYGVNGPSVFASLSYFDATLDFPADIMHDCMEGVIPRLTETILKCLVDERITTVAKFNADLMSFVFKGQDRVNKPEPLKADGKIIGSASQKMCLFIFLPFLCELSKCSKALKLYALAHEVIMYTFARCVSRKDLEYLQQKIESLLLYLKENFPNFHFTPKFHYMLHYPMLMAQYGPLRDLWCMRYEAKHQYFKAVASTLGNFINIAFSLAGRHQMLQCYQFSSKEAEGQELRCNKSGKLRDFTSLPLDVQRLLCFANSKVWSVKKATYAACTYEIGAAILVDFMDNGDPVFLKVMHLLSLHDGHLDIVGKLLLPQSFCKKHFAYRVADCGWGRFHPENQRDCSLFWPYELHSEVFIKMPYNVPCWSTA